MSKTAIQKLDATKLYANAILSIKLGIEDFQLSQLPVEDGGIPQEHYPLCEIFMQECFYFSNTK